MSARLEDRGPPTTCSSLYVHVPFCRDRCTYCSFATVRDQPESYQSLVEGLLREMDRAHGPLDRLTSIYLGGGTPGLLTPRALGALMKGIERRFTASSQTEVTIEANPSNVSAEALQLWRDAGIGRLSIGVQTLHDAALAGLGRHHDGARARRAIGDVSTHWEGTWSVDLLLGWPGQDGGQLAADLEYLLDAAPPHLSLYSLTIESSTGLSSLHQQGFKVSSSAVEMARLVDLAVQLVGPRGYERYEVSNFALEGHRSRHNQVYWRCEDYLGVGPGAASSRHPYRWINVRDLEGYLARTSGRRSVRQATERIDPLVRLLEVLAVGLRTSDGVSTNELDRRFTPSWRPMVASAASELIEAGHVILTGARLALPAGELSRADAVIERVARGLPQEGAASMSGATR